MSNNLNNGANDVLDDILAGIYKSVEKNKEKSKRTSSSSDIEPKKKSKEKEPDVNMSYEVIDYYKVIGASPNDTQTEINKKYKEKVTQYHPDKVKGKIEQYPPEERKRQEQKYNRQYELIREAEKFLKDPEKRKLYDMQRKKSKEHKSFTDHRCDFENFIKSQEANMTDDVKRLNEISYKQKISEMDAKHGFDSSKKYNKDSYKFEGKDFSRRLSDLQIERGQQTAECIKKNMFEGSAFDIKKFNKECEVKMKKQKKTNEGNRNVVLWEGVAPANGFDSGSQFMAIGDDEEGRYEDMHARPDEVDGLYARALGSDDERSSNSDDDELIDDEPTKIQIPKSYEQLMKEREQDSAKFENRKYDGTWGDVNSNPFNPSYQLGEMIGDTKDIDSDKKSKRERIEAYKSLVYDSKQ